MIEAIEEAKKAEDIMKCQLVLLLFWMVKSLRRHIILRETKQNAVAHAELLAIDEACEKLGTWRLRRCNVICNIRTMSNVCRGNCFIAD